MLQDAKGYTLIELIVVIALIGLVMSLTVPRFQSAILTDDLKGTTRKITGLIRTLRNEAIREQKTFYLKFDLESNRFWIDYPAMTEEERGLKRESASSFPAGVQILDIWYRGEGKKMSGEMSILFSKRGYIQPSIIHLGSEDGRKYTLVLSPFLGRVKILEDYVDFEDI
ncbi:Tfp pilus assembly protein FimT/FimU [Thermodesulfobacteriota bacterium]